MPDMAKLIVWLDSDRIEARDIVSWTVDALEGSQVASKLMRRHCRTETWGSGLRAVYVRYSCGMVGYRATWIREDLECALKPMFQRVWLVRRATRIIDKPKAPDPKEDKRVLN